MPESSYEMDWSIITSHDQVHRICADAMGEDEFDNCKDNREESHSLMMIDDYIMETTKSDEIANEYTCNISSAAQDSSISSDLVASSTFIPIIRKGKEIPREINQWLNYCTSEDWIKLYDSCNAFLQANSFKNATWMSGHFLCSLAQLKLESPAQSILLQMDSLKSTCKKYLKGPDLNLSQMLQSFVSSVAKDMIGNLQWSAASEANEFISLCSLHAISHNAFEKMIREAKLIANKLSVSNDWEVKSNDQTAKVIWERTTLQFEINGITSIDELMTLIGLDTVKVSFLNQYNKIVISKEQKVPLGSSNYNARFDGNPGTGKTTVARIYARFLKEMKVLPEESIIEETSGSSLVSSGGVKTLKDILVKLKNVGGGVIFIDEAYQLNPQSDREGRQVLDFLLTHSEKLEGEYGKIAWIFAGYKKQMDTLFEHNPGLPSRFPLKLTFEDYTEDELLKIFLHIMESGGRTVDGKASSVAKPKKLRDTSMKLPSARQNMYYSLNKQKKPEIDVWGNTWTWNNSYNYFEDEYDNMTAIGASNLGTRSNPLVSRTDSSYWYYDQSKKKWYSNNSDGNMRWSEYPGKPVVIVHDVAIPFKVTDEKWVRIAIRRLSKGRGRVGFGNARAVRNLFDQTRQRQAARLSRERSYGFDPNVMIFDRSDLLGPKPDIVTLQNTKVWKDLQELEGLHEVKEEIRKLMNLVIQNAEREENEQPQLEISLNRVFLGNPGTGKTTLGKIYAQLLTTLGLLSKGECIVKNPSDFIGNVIGSSESTTRGILSQAEGSVLVIDEAYLLNPSMGSTGSSQDPYKSAVIDTIVEQVQGTPGDDRAVVLLGYRKEMEALMAAANPGLSRRFEMENAFIFADYDDNSLIRILMKECKKDGLEINLDVASHAVKKLAKARAQPNFGNAGSLKTLYSEAKKSLLSRQPKGSQTSVLTASDFGESESPISEEELLKGLVGCDKVVKKLTEYKSLIELCRANGDDPKKYVEFNFIFAGPPGTGKTTVARRMGTMFYSLGLLPCADVIEMSASDLITGYVGQAGKKTHDILTKARGKVLFIDEAYRMNPDQGGLYMQEVIDELVQQLTSTEFKQQLVVILAGYDEDMERLLNVNQGLRSRFSEKLEFSPFTSSEVTKMFLDKIQEANLCDISSDVKNQLKVYADRLVLLSNFGNGRDVETLSKRAIRNYAMIARSKSSDRTMIIADLKITFEPFLEEKMKLETEEKNKSRNSKEKLLNHLMATESESMKDISMNTSTKAAAKESLDDEKEDEMEISNTTYNSKEIFNKEFQKVLDEKGLNSLKGVKGIASYSVDSNDFNDLVTMLMNRTNLTGDEVRDLLINWQHDTRSLEEKIEEIEQEKELAKAKKCKALLPIWRCGVCGRADKPFIACYVQPYIVGYKEFDLSEL